MFTPNPNITTLLDNRPRPITVAHLRDELDAIIKAGNGDALVTTTNGEATIIVPPFSSDKTPTVRIR